MKRKVLPEELKDVLAISKFVTLYLLKTFSPTTFLLSDPLNNEHLVEIGEKLSCSCLPGYDDHCIHTFYVLLRIYKIDPTNPLAFQKSYSQNEIQKIIHWNDEHQKALQAEKQEKKNRQERKQAKEREEKKPQKINPQTKRQWPQLQPGTICSICYDDIQNQTAIIDCKKCQKYFHTKCLKVWILHKKNSQSSISCPMCRSQFQMKIDQRLKEEELFFVKYHQSFEIKCSECSQEILIKIFKCLLCSEVYLCEKCYYGWLHKSHDKFLGKFSKKSEWTVTTRSQFNMSKLNASLEYFKKYKNSEKGDIKVLMGPNYEKFLEENIKKPTIIEHIVESLLCVEKQVHKTYKKLQFEQKELVCCICRKKKIISLRRMTCKHFIDEKCLNFLLKNKIKQCPLDKSFVLPGLEGIQINF